MTNHSGYDFPWSLWSVLPFQGSSYAHDAHHSVGGGLAARSGNYASFFGWWDALCGTELPAAVVLTAAHAKDEADGGGWGGGVAAVGDGKKKAA